MIKLIVGLQNPGPDYAKTRHNAGAWFLDAMITPYHLQFKMNKKMHGLVAEFDHDAERCYVLLPLTFMNHSGQSIRALCDFYHIAPQEILVAHDDLDLEVGRIKLKKGGGHGGHNGLRDTIAHLGTPEFHRLRIGIGHPGVKAMVHDYVLAKPSQHDKTQILEAIERAVTILPTVLNGQLERAMNQLHTQ